MDDNQNFYINNVTENNSATDSSTPTNGGTDKNSSKRNKTLLIVLISAIVLIVGLVIAFLFLFVFKQKDPDTAVKDALNTAFPSINMHKEIADYCNASELINGMADGEYQNDFSISISNLSGSSIPDSAYLLKSSGIKGSFYSNMKAKKNVLDASITYGGIDFSDLSLYLEDELVGITVPMLFDGTLTVNPKKLGEDYINSYFADEYSEDIPTDLSIDLYKYCDDFYAKLGSFSPDSSDTTQDASDSTKKLSDALSFITFSKKEDTTLTINNVEVNVTEYTGDITPGYFTDKLGEVYDAISESELIKIVAETGVNVTKSMFIDAFVKEDPVCSVYLDSAYNLKAIRLKFTGSYNDVIVSFDIDIDFLGEENPGDVIEGKISANLFGFETSIKFAHSIVKSDDVISAESSIKTSGNIFNISSSSEFDTKNGDLKSVLTVSPQSSDKLTITSDSKITFEKKGQDITFTTNDLSIVSGDSFAMSLNGYITINTGSSAYPDKPLPIREPLKMSEDELTALYMEIYNNLLSSPLGSLLPF